MRPDGLLCYERTSRAACMVCSTIYCMCCRDQSGRRNSCTCLCINKACKSRLCDSSKVDKVRGSTESVVDISTVPNQQISPLHIDQASREPLFAESPPNLSTLISNREQLVQVMGCGSRNRSREKAAAAAGCVAVCGCRAADAGSNVLGSYFRRSL